MSSSSVRSTARDMIILVYLPLLISATALATREEYLTVPFSLSIVMGL